MVAQSKTDKDPSVFTKNFQIDFLLIQSFLADVINQTPLLQYNNIKRGLEIIFDGGFGYNHTGVHIFK